MEAINNLIAVFNASIGLIVILCLAMHQRMVKFPASHKMGLWVGGVGLTYQAVDWMLLGPDFHRQLMILPALSWTMILLSFIFCGRLQRVTQ